MRSTPSTPVAALLLTATLCLSACGGAGTPTTDETSPTTTGTSGDPVVAVPTTVPDAGAPPGDASDAAWASIADRIGDDGQIDLPTALEAFSLTVAPLPGVSAASSEEPLVDSATGAVRWLSGHLDELSAEQRAAVGASLSTDEVAAEAVAPIGLRQVTTPAAPVRGCLGEVPTLADAPGTETIRVALDGVIGELSARLGPLSAATHLGFAPEGVGVKAAIVSVPYNSDCDNLATSCSILIAKKGKSLTGVALRAVLAREVVHCYQATVVPIHDAYATPSWIIEGFAMWASEELVGGSGRPEAAAQWRRYLRSPEDGLFSRDYDAIGFYGHLEQSGIDVWSLFRPMIEAGGNDQAWNVSVGQEPDVFLDSWPSSFARQPARGPAWEVYGPGIPATNYPVVSSIVGDGDRIDLVAERAGNVVHDLDVQTDIVTFLLQDNTHGRIGLDGGAEWTLDDAVGSGFCTLPTGCLCPNGNQPIGLVLVSFPWDHALIAFNCGLREARVFVLGESLDEACSRVPEVELDPCLVGEWASADFKVPSPVDYHLNFVGGGGAIVTIAEDGSATYDFSGMRPIEMLDEQTGTVVRES
jgi:hypothetical protein